MKAELDVRLALWIKGGSIIQGSLAPLMGAWVVQTRAAQGETRWPGSAAIILAIAVAVAVAGRCPREGRRGGGRGGEGRSGLL